MKPFSLAAISLGLWLTMAAQQMDIKFRREPFSVYLQNRDGKENGREVLFVKNANGDKLLVRERGFLASLAGTVTLTPDDKQVMDENRYAITEIGVHKILEKALAIWEADAQKPEGEVTVKKLANIQAAGKNCDGFEIRYRSKTNDSEFFTSRVFFDRQSKLPLHAEQYGWPDSGEGKPPLLERYTYVELKPNVGLTDANFSSENPAYGFSNGK
ncbi:MAG: DUF1571 domain-containing protein [Planctomycetaceae bacterium]